MRESSYTCICSSEIFSAGKHSLTIFTVTSELITCICIGTPPWLIGVREVVGLIIIVAGVFIVSVIWYEVKNKGTSSHNNYIIVLLSLCSLRGLVSL